VQVDLDVRLDFAAAQSAQAAAVEAGRKAVFENFSAEAMARETLRIFERAISSRQS
jgi:hypothetical protein